MKVEGGEESGEVGASSHDAAGGETRDGEAGGEEADDDSSMDSDSDVESDEEEKDSEKV